MLDPLSVIVSVDMDKILGEYEAISEEPELGCQIYSC